MLLLLLSVCSGQWGHGAFFFTLVYLHMFLKLRLLFIIIILDGKLNFFFANYNLQIKRLRLNIFI